MFYEMRTYDMAPGTTDDFLKRVEEALPHRVHLSPMVAMWRTEIGPLNQLIHVWPYEDLNDRARIRGEATKNPNWPPKTEDVVLNMQSDIMTPAPFMRPLTAEVQELGNIYEMRVYTYRPGSMPTVIERWAEAVPHREKYSPLAACWYTEIGGLNKFYHIWAYQDLGERDRIRAEASKDPHWPPQTREFTVRQENKMLVPASFSPLR